MSEVLLDASSVAVYLGHRLVLDEVDIALCTGDFVGLIGPNGAGKTTLLRAVLGLTPLTRGQVRIAGLPPARARGVVGYVPQRHEFAWDFPISVEDTVMTGRTRKIGWLRSPRPADRDAVDAALEQVSMVDLRRRPIGELSGGQRQRVLVARALATRPRLLLLDEPFTGVDMPTQQLLAELFSRLAAEGNALLMTTHHVAAATQVCTRMCLLNVTIVAEGKDLDDPEVLLRALGMRMSDQALASSRSDA